MRRAVLGTALGGLAGAGAYYARHVEPDGVEVVALPLILPRLMPEFDGYRIALIGDLHADAWMTGQRREQAVTRAELPFEEQDEARGIPKFNPLADWSEPEVWAYLKRHNVPVNDLHAKGYPSIGCEPCTRAVRAGEDVRAGRWWWESKDSKECGLHEQNIKH